MNTVNQPRTAANGFSYDTQTGLQSTTCSNRSNHLNPRPLESLSSMRPPIEIPIFLFVKDSLSSAQLSSGPPLLSSPSTVSAPARLLLASCSVEKVTQFHLLLFIGMRPLSPPYPSHVRDDQTI